ncbi:Polyisoprenoid-binding protein YceI [Chitinophaga rupis]|uniref:Polyisoprenoid-binding protein YceI n=1 Tax=Chitinophaga rupis TaxID=573321 RepID=A0A1H7MB49_9BACT|nr:YceI family protein [Chitinophaga rupis]SEL07955.1 Polyisoprenoid-binding protein YceI [Chitinophaga rupis]
MRYILLIIGCLIMACQQAPKADKATISDARSVQEGEGVAYQLNTSESYVQWIGTKPTGQHTGLFKIKSGTLNVKDSAITGGKFVIDVTSLEDVDLKADTSMKNKLERELKGAMFFDVAQFPEAEFAITGVKPFVSDGNEVLLKDATHTIQGNLTIKQISKNISFPAKIVLQKNEVTATANFNLDRTLWGMTYRADKSVQDKLINSLVNIQFSIKAER